MASKRQRADISAPGLGQGFGAVQDTKVGFINPTRSGAPPVQARYGSLPQLPTNLRAKPVSNAVAQIAGSLSETFDSLAETRRLFAAKEIQTNAIEAKQEALQTYSTQLGDFTVAFNKEVGEGNIFLGDGDHPFGEFVQSTYGNDSWWSSNKAFNKLPDADKKALRGELMTAAMVRAAHTDVSERTRFTNTRLSNLIGRQDAISSQYKPVLLDDGTIAQDEEGSSLGIREANQATIALHAGNIASASDAIEARFSDRVYNYFLKNVSLLPDTEAEMSSIEKSFDGLVKEFENEDGTSLLSSEAIGKERSRLDGFMRVLPQAKIQALEEHLKIVEASSDPIGTSTATDIEQANNAKRQHGILRALKENYNFAGKTWTPANENKLFKAQMRAEALDSIRSTLVHPIGEASDPLTLVIPGLDGNPDRTEDLTKMNRVQRLVALQASYANYRELLENDSSPEADRDRAYLKYSSEVVDAALSDQDPVAFARHIFTPDRVAQIRNGNNPRELLDDFRGLMHLTGDAELPPELVAKGVETLRWLDSRPDTIDLSAYQRTKDALMGSVLDTLMGEEMYSDAFATLFGTRVPELDSKELPRTPSSLKKGLSTQVSSILVYGARSGEKLADRAIDYSYGKLMQDPLFQGEVSKALDPSVPDDVRVGRVEKIQDRLEESLMELMGRSKYVDSSGVPLYLNKEQFPGMDSNVVEALYEHDGLIASSYLIPNDALVAREEAVLAALSSRSSMSADQFVERIANSSFSEGHGAIRATLLSRLEAAGGELHHKIQAFNNFVSDVQLNSGFSAGSKGELRMQLKLDKDELQMATAPISADSIQQLLDEDLAELVAATVHSSPRYKARAKTGQWFLGMFDLDFLEGYNLAPRRDYGDIPGQIRRFADNLSDSESQVTGLDRADGSPASRVWKDGDMYSIQYNGPLAEVISSDDVERNHDSDKAQGLNGSHLIGRAYGRYFSDLHSGALDRPENLLPATQDFNVNVMERGVDRSTRRILDQVVPALAKSHPDARLFITTTALQKDLQRIDLSALFNQVSSRKGVLAANFRIEFRDKDGSRIPFSYSEEGKTVSKDMLEFDLSDPVTLGLFSQISKIR